MLIGSCYVSAPISFFNNLRVFVKVQKHLDTPQLKANNIFIIVGMLKALYKNWIRRLLLLYD